MYSVAAARITAAREYAHAEVGSASLCFQDPARGRVLSTFPACRVRRWDVQQYYSSTNNYCEVTAEVARTALGPQTHPPTMYSSSALGRKTAVREVVHAEVVLLLRIGISMLTTIPRHIGDRGRLLSTLPASTLAWGVVLSPVRPCAVWGGRGVVARPRAVA